MILKYQQFINESLGSHDIEIIVRRIENLFSKYNIPKDINWRKKEGHYSIHSDRDDIRKLIDMYKDDEDRVNNFRNALNDYKKGDIYIKLNGCNSEKLSKDLLDLIKSSGYFISVLGTNHDDEVTDKKEIENYLLNNKKIYIGIEPIFDEKINFEGEYLYHTTDKKNLEKILKLGLIPKSKNTRSFYPERIYLSPNIEYMKYIKDELRTDKPGEYVFLRIDNFKGLSLYNDLRFKGGFYTYDNIPPKYINIMSEKNIS
jgi:hypothetical protein